MRTRDLFTAIVIGGVSVTAGCDRSLTSGTTSADGASARDAAAGVDLIADAAMAGDAAVASDAAGGDAAGRDLASPSEGDAFVAIL